MTGIEIVVESRAGLAPRELLSFRLSWGRWWWRNRVVEELDVRSFFKGPNGRVSRWRSDCETDSGSFVVWM